MNSKQASLGSAAAGRGFFALSCLSLAVIAVANVAVWFAADDDTVRQNADAHRARARTVPMADFVRDANDDLRGRVVSDSGEALAGVVVRDRKSVV